MLMQLFPCAWAGNCRPGEVLCGPSLCSVSGDWHIAWNIPYNNLLGSFEQTLGTHFTFPTCLVTVLVVPLAYGAWHFVLLNVIAGPILAAN
jgi:hypothetical protein